MKSLKFIIPLLTCAFAILIWSCSSDDSNTSSDTNTDTSTDPEAFDRQVMLINWADNIIIPSYQAFSSATDVLKTASDAFEAQPSEATFATLRDAFETAYIAWQRVGIYRVGPAETAFMRNFLNIYPTNTTAINVNIDTGNYALEDINRDDEQGFPALDYLLFGLADSDADVLALYTSDAEASKYLNYLTDVVDRINTLSDDVLAQWQNGYRDTYVNNSGSSNTSATDVTVDRLFEYYEVHLRNAKIGIPAGMFSDGVTNPENVEAFFKKDLSRRLAIEGLDAVQRLFRGTALNSNATGESLESYLNFLNTMKDGEDLSTLINNAFNASRAAFSELDNNFSEQINTNNTAMLTAFESLQDNVVLLKSDMASALDIRFTFQSGDGD